MDFTDWTDNILRDGRGERIALQIMKQRLSYHANAPGAHGAFVRIGTRNLKIYA
jgi:hypothetical protein